MLVWLQEKLGPQCMRWLEDQVASIREAATKTLQKIAQVRRMGSLTSGSHTAFHLASRSSIADFKLGMVNQQCDNVSLAAVVVVG